LNHFRQSRQKSNRFSKRVLVVENFRAKRRHDVRIVIVLCQPQKQLHLLKRKPLAQRKAGVGKTIGLVCIASSSKINLSKTFGIQLKFDVKTRQNQNGACQRRHIRLHRVALKLFVSIREKINFPSVILPFFQSGLIIVLTIAPEKLSSASI